MRAHPGRRGELLEVLRELVDAADADEPGTLVYVMHEAHDDYAASQVSSVDDIVEQWNRGLAWGCEADDPFVGLAFDTRILPKGKTMPAFFASDLGHWDVQHFDEPLEEAHELVEHGIIDDDQLRDFLFVNPVKFYGSLNPDFFAGTAIEKEANEVLGR